MLSHRLRSVVGRSVIVYFSPPPLICVESKQKRLMPEGHYPSKPSEVDAKLRLGICRLLQRKYAPMGENSKFLCANLVNWALCDSPQNEEARRFCEANRTLIEQEARNLHEDPAVNCALSVLYAFTLIWLGPTNPDKSAKLVERACELSILIMSAKEICPTDDAIRFLAFIDQFAEGILAR